MKRQIIKRMKCLKTTLEVKGRRKESLCGNKYKVNDVLYVLSK